MRPLWLTKNNGFHFHLSLYYYSALSLSIISFMLLYFSLCLRLSSVHCSPFSLSRNSPVFCFCFFFHLANRKNPYNPQTNNNGCAVLNNLFLFSRLFFARQFICQPRKVRCHRMQRMFVMCKRFDCKTNTMRIRANVVRSIWWHLIFSQFLVLLFFFLWLLLMTLDLSSYAVSNWT